MRDKDKKAIHDLFCEFHYADNLGLIKSKLVEYVATARREAREAERKRLALVIQSLPVTAAGAGAFKVSAIAALEAQS